MTSPDPKPTEVLAPPEPALTLTMPAPLAPVKAPDAAAAMVAERCGEGAFETPLQALVVETTR